VAWRLAGGLRRRLQPVERMLPVRLPGSGAAPGQRADAASEDDPAARIDAARERLRATIEPPDDERG
jgi:hypothetical protein